MKELLVGLQYSENSSNIYPATIDNRDLTEISSTTLLNILEAHDSGVERMEGSMN
jgi:hypothetical protein